jgi:outer membrane protein assembly factor BamB
MRASKISLRMRSSRSLLTITVTLSLASALITKADDWPQWRGPNRDGISRETGWSTKWPSGGPSKAWDAKVGVGYSSYSVANGRLYTMGNVDETDYVYCLDTNTGAEIWKHSYPCPSKDPNGYHGTRCTPTVDGDRVYTVSREGDFFCLSAKDGKVLWSKDFKKDFNGKVPMWGYSGSPLIEKNLVLVEVGGLGTSVVAMTKDKGTLVWKSGNDPVGYSSLVAYDYNNQRSLALFPKDAVVGRLMAGGKELWRFPWKTSYGVNAATPIVKDDKVFISSGYNYGCALLQFSQNPPKVVWQNKNMRNHVNSCVLWQNYLYGFDEGELKCLSWDTGEVKWGSKSYGKGSLTLADGKLIIWSANGKLAVAEASPDAFKEISSAQILGGKDTWAAPVLANAKIYCRSLENLVCLDIKGQ